MKYATFATRLQHLLDTDELPAQFLAELCECNRVSVHQWLKGDHLPRIEKLIRIAAWWDVSLDWLLREDVTIPFRVKEAA